MNKHIFNYLALGITALLLNACNDSEKDLLESKVYFEKKEYTLSVEDGKETMIFDLTARLSSQASSPVDISYSIADASVVEAYNAQYGTAYEMFDASNAKLSSTTSTIQTGKVYADNVTLELSGLGSLEDGKSFILPVRLQSSTETLPGTSIAYFFISKPLKIRNVGNFRNSYIKVKFPAGTYFSSFTYETLIYVNSFNSNNTVMGTEGIMILRIGDAGGGVTPEDIIEVAGQQGYKVTNKLQSGRWYHLALTYDQPSGKTAIYVNGEIWAQANWAISGFDPNADQGFNIGKIPGFPWGERPLNGCMSEIRVWSVARTQNQLQQNMLTVDPNSDGLALYYKLDGSDTEESGVIKDASGHIDGINGNVTIKKLDTPVTIE